MISQKNLGEAINAAFEKGGAELIDLIQSKITRFEDEL